MLFSHRFLLSAALALATAAPSNQSPVFLPLTYKFGDYPKITTNILYGTPAQTTPIETVVDLGSANYWVYGPNATLNFGAQGLGETGPCNITITPFYNYPASKTATRGVKHERVYSYGGNGKFVYAHKALNDTINFSSAPSLQNIRVEVSNYTMLRQLADKSCMSGPYDHSILGISEYIPNKAPPIGTAGPSFRQNLLTQGRIASPTLSMWFDAPPANAPANYIFKGTMLLGALPKDKYSGPLVQLKPNPPTDAYVGYYVSTPTFAITNVHNTSQVTTVKTISKTPRCLLDSGSGQDYLPLVEKSFLGASGLIDLNGGGVPSFNGPCESIPRDAALSTTFTGPTGKKVTVKVPLRNYARDTPNTPGKCALQMELGTPGSCTLGAPFTSAAFLAFNDEKNQIALAQGLVSSGADAGTNGLGSVTVVKRGQGLPA